MTEVDLTTPPDRATFDASVEGYCAGQNATKPKARVFYLVLAFSRALRRKLDCAQEVHQWPEERSWLSPGYTEADNDREMARHLDKGDPLDVAAYCAFAWFRRWRMEGVARALAEPVIEEYRRTLLAPMNHDEPEEARALAWQIIDDPGTDPDSERAVLARQLLRALEKTP